MDKLIKPYEISVWEDILDTSTNGATYKEIKIAVIGSNTMEGYNKVYEPVFTKKTNGEKTLTFSLRYQYFDPYIGATVINPFASYLINERKVKLYYDNQWYEFLIKEHTESSDGLVWTYTAVDAFVNELSKNGYNKEFSADLGNNQGTAIELAKAVVEGTDWIVDETNSSVGPQEISEAIYNATLNPSSGVKIVNAETGVEVTFANTQSIFVFYNYVANKDGQFVQFILQESNPNNYVVDDNNTIKATNYRIETELTYNESGVFKKKNTNTNIITIVKIGDRFDLSTEYHAYRKVYGHLSTYDPVMKRTVKRYGLDGLKSEIYSYTDYIYSTSNLVVNYITNGDRFNIYDNGTLQGWNEKAEIAGSTYPNIRLTTYPAIEASSAIQSLTSYTQIEGYMEVKFPGIFNNYKNGIFNSGIEDSASILTSISAGQEFVFRWRGATSTSQHGILSAMGNNVIRVVVAKYTKPDIQVANRYYNKVDPKNIILDFNTTAQTLDNYITGGTFPIDSNTGNVDYSAYVIDGIAQEPSTKYIYKYEGNDYVWDSRDTNNLRYVPLNNNNNPPFFPHYYYMTATAQRSITEAELSEPSTKIGIFIYTKSGVNNYYYFQDIQLTKLYRDANNNILTIGNIPTAIATPIEYYYIQPKKGTAAENVEIYTKKSALASSISTDENNIKPIYNENATKYLSISESHSNCYNLLQTIAETFECWIDLVVSHDNRGAITYSYKKTQDTFVNTAKTYYIRSGSPGSYTYTPVDEPTENDLTLYYELKPNKKVVLREYIGKNNFAGFKYGINLNTIERTINSDEIVTKLYVTPAQSEYADEGSIAIRYASMNPSGEQYILNFDYYYKQGLITNVSDARADLNSYYVTMNEINKQLRGEEEKRRNLEKSLVALNSQRNVYTNLIDEAKSTVSEAKDEFESLTGKTYDGYRTAKTSEQIVDLYYFPTTDNTVWQYKDYFSRNGHTYTKVTKFEENENPSAKNYYEYLPDLENNNTLMDLISKIYINSYAINNYTGILTNIEEEYKIKRAELRGSEEFTITIGLIDTGSSMDKLKIIVSDYINGFYFTVAGESYHTDINTKVFDIETNSSNITINQLPNNYKLFNGTGQQINIGGTIVPNTERVIVLTLKPQTEFDGVEDRVEKLQTLKDEAERWFHNKYNRFIQEGTWSSTDYIDSNLYYLDAVSVSNTSAQPQISYSINVVEVSELEGFKWYNFDAGDKTYVEDTEFFGWSEVGGILTPAREEVIVSEVEWHLEEPENNVITVQNYKTRFEDLFQRISATVQTVEYNEATYAKTSSLMDAYGMLSQTVLLDSLNNISGQPYTLTSDGSIRIDGDRITIRDLKNKANIMTLESTGLRISSDGGKTWATAVNAFGINLDKVFTGKINTNKIVIGSDENPSFRWDYAGISAYKRNSSSDVYDLNTYVRFDQYGLYGIANDSSFIASSLEDVKNKASFAVTWDGFFIRNAYTSGRVEISSVDDFRVVQTYDNEDHERIKIGALEFDSDGQPIKYGIRINRAVYNNTTQKWEDKPAFVTGDDGNIEITGVINALGGNFTGLVQVGEDDPHILIDGEDALIKTSNYSDGASYGWMINKYGDAVFNNITARGAIKTAVFEYAEIQAVGGIFIFRPSSTIRHARISGSDLVVEVEKPALFAKLSTQQYSWCKISNYTSDGSEPDVDVLDILANNGLSHVYKISNVDISKKEVTLSGGASFVSAVQQEDETIADVLASLEGGALVDMGREDGSSNYGIGVNSSDNTVNLPRRAITLFETEVHPEAGTDVKVTYKYKGILGTLPDLSSEYASQNTYKYLKDTQGIYTNNMYIGDANQFVSFYTDTDDLDSNNRPKRKLKIVADEVVYRRDDGSYGDVKDIEIEQGAQGPPGASALQISILSTFGTSIRDSTGGGVGALYAKITKDGVEIDPIGNNIQAVIDPNSEILNPINGQYCIVINNTNKTAIPYKYNGSWVAVSASTNVTYAWTFRNKDNVPVTIPGVVVSNKCLYVSADMIDKKLTAEVQIIVE